MKQYLLSETELENVSFINAVSAFCFSAAAFIAPWPIQRAIEYMNAPVGSPVPEGIYWLMGFLVIAFLLGGFYSSRKRGSIHDIIKNETVHDGEG